MMLLGKYRTQEAFHAETRQHKAKFLSGACSRDPENTDIFLTFLNPLYFEAQSKRLFRNVLSYALWEHCVPLNLSVFNFLDGLL